MKFLALLVVGFVVLVACLPDVSTELSDLEARAILEREVLNLCSSRSQTLITGVINSIQSAQATATRDYWKFDITAAGAGKKLEALVFPSRIISGSFIREIQTRTCR